MHHANIVMFYSVLILAFMIVTREISELNKMAACLCT